MHGAVKAARKNDEIDRRRSAWTWNVTGRSSWDGEAGPPTWSVRMEDVNGDEIRGRCVGRRCGDAGGVGRAWR